MAAVSPLHPTIAPAEQRMLLHGVSWQGYVAMRDLLEDGGVRLTYVRGVLELMSLSREHELWKKNIARFVEHFAYLRGIDLRGYGSTTFESEGSARGLEPDECYLIGKKLADFPEIVLEVVRTSPLLDKLDVYRVFGVAEVWVFRDGAFTVHALDAAAGRYTIVPASRLVPGLDLETVARYAQRDDTPQALREFEAEISRS